ncbi:pyruvate dehydrogenase complex dihydrolipoamide acetyltransferase [bacterium]|nr:pyruvate dehydrogenase complex dihydrolipoamide acetyltransferase [bacterium]
MPIEILMPALSPTMTEGNLARWLVKEGDKIKSGQVIAEIETDKATMEVEAVDEGIIGKIMVPDGAQAVKVNDLIALLLEDGEDKKALEGYAANSNSPAAAAPAKKDTAPAAAASAPAAAPATSKSGEKVFASPLAKRVAEQGGVSLGNVQGTGPHGRIIKADVEEAIASGSAKGGKPAKGAAASLVGRNPVESIDVPLSMMRKVIASRLLESKQNVPHFYLSVDIEMDSLLNARKQLNTAAEASLKDKDAQPAYKISVNDMIVKATAQALRDVPEANASWGGDKIIQFNNVDVSVAVAIDGGLITPIVRNADQKSLSTLSNELKDLIKRARAGKLQPEEFQGGGFSISNLGMYGIKQFNAIINPPQACILAVGATEERVVAKKGQMHVAHVATITLSSDHRVVDGAVGAVFLEALKRYLENPLAMMA